MGRPIGYLTTARTRPLSRKWRVLMMRTMMTMWMWMRTIRMRTMMRMMIGRPIGYLSTARTRGALKEKEGVDDDDDGCQ